MSQRVSRPIRALSGALAALAASACFLACSAGAGGPSDSTDVTSQAVSAGQGVLHSNVTRDSWQRHVGNNHGGWDNDRSCHPQPLALCSQFDDEFIGQDGGRACARVTTPDCPDRVDTWDNDIVFDFVIALGGDCRFGQWGPPLLTDTDVANYLNDLLAFTLQFFGCPEQGTTTPLTFGLIPSALQGDKFTNADLDALSDTYAAAVAQALSDNGSPALTPQQTQALSVKLHRLARHVPNRVPGKTFTFSTCAPDAVTPATSADGNDDDANDCR